MNRRDALRLLAAGTALTTIDAAWHAPASEVPKTGSGLVVYSLGLRRKAMLAQRPKRDIFEPLAFLEYCRSLGAAGVQLPLGLRDAEYCSTLRDQARRCGMYIEGIVNLPKEDRDLDRFEGEVRTAADVGALCLRTAIMPGRRYEHFATVSDYQAAAEQSRQAVLRAVPVLEHHKVRLAIENHKDRRADELVALLRDIGNRNVGACIDLGNNFALLEDPVAVVEALAPWAFSVHIKDQAVREYDEGFLFADVPLGDGFLDLKKMVDTLRHAKPEVRFNLETISRDPLRVPVFTEEYWATLPDVPGSALARTIRTVRARRTAHLPEISRMSPEEQLECETAGVVKSFAHASQNLGL